ncbi:MAG TPA: isochorismatase family protein [Ktedonobacterales bacterium]
MDALIIVDVQNDFCPGGALPVPSGDQIVPVLNEYMARAAQEGIPIVASQDWHPMHTEHFAQDGGRWPGHCLQDSWGAAFYEDLRLPPSALIVRKGLSGHDDGYSAFEGTLADGRDLKHVLDDLGVTRVYVGGLATDYCVLQTVLGARRAGLETVWLRDASLPVEVNAGDGEQAERDMLAAGARACTLERFNPQRHRVSSGQ